jgi:hypothetical protein
MRNEKREISRVFSSLDDEFKYFITATAHHSSVANSYRRGFKIISYHFLANYLPRLSADDTDGTRGIAGKDEELASLIIERDR